VLTCAAHLTGSRCGYSLVACPEQQVPHLVLVETDRMFFLRQLRQAYHQVWACECAAILSWPQQATALLLADVLDLDIEPRSLVGHATCLLQALREPVTVHHSEAVKDNLAAQVTATYLLGVVVAVWC
jgi:hypothetical protein